MIQLPVRSATAFLRNLILATTERFPELHPAATEFQKKDLGGRKLSLAMVEFESARASMPHRVEIAQFMTDWTQSQMVYEREGQSAQPLSEYMRSATASVPVSSKIFGKGGCLVPGVTYKGEIHRAAGLLELVESFQERRTMTDAATNALQWIIGRGEIDLSGWKFVMFGANAELAPTEMLLRAGASVLWIDIISPEKILANQLIQSGQLVYPTTPLNLVEHPREIAAMIQTFADGEPVHIGGFEYKGGEAMETRLSAARNAIIRRLDQDLIASISFYVSPTSPAPAEPEDVRAAQTEYATLSPWLQALNRLHYFKPNHRSFEDETHWVDAIVARQGVSYLISQYVEKILAAEVFATRGTRPDEKRRPVLVSANTAGITRTRNMQIPAFQLGFAGAETLGLETYEPETTRGLSGLLMLHDLTNPFSPGSPKNGIENDVEKAAGLRREQIHGRIYSFPFALEETILLAGFIGIAQDPKFALKTLVGSRKAV